MSVTLADQAALQTRRALAAGALGPIDTEATLVEDAGLPFVVRVIANLRRKRAATAGPEGDPFAPPYEPDLFVGDLSPTHVVLLNKFPVLARHLLLVTREYESQEAVLTRADCEALLLALSEIDGLAFHNGGEIAGASQPHKHLQLVPLPLAEVGPPLPFASALEQIRLEGDLGRSPAWPFPHAAARMEPAWLRAPASGAEALVERYRQMLDAIGRLPDEDGRTGPYNLLATREWLWLVPRTREHAGGISVNALGFAGALLAPDVARRDALVRTRPMQILTEVSRA